MPKIIKEMEDFIQAEYKLGKSYHEINTALYHAFGIELTDDSIRYHVKRKYIPQLSPVEKLRRQNISKKLIIADLHCPHVREDIFDIIATHADEIDEIIFNGDIVDCAEISRYDHLTALPLHDEMIYTHNLLSVIDALTPNAKKTIVLGNHELRWRRYLDKTNTKLNPLHSLNIMKEIVNGFSIYDHKKNVEVKYRPLNRFTVLDSWYTQIHDLIVCHPISFSKVSGRTAWNSCEFFANKGMDFTAVVTAHTHKQAMIRYKGKHGYESGGLCKPMPYADEGNLGYTPQNDGYFLAVFRDGKLDINESRLYSLEPEKGKE